ncbi:excalibur calcium-binding domain-containing protein [Micromonospora sp. NPDC003241]
MKPIAERQPQYVPTPEPDLATITASPTVETSATASRRPSPTPSRTPKPDVYYRNCDAVRSAGKAPLKRGQPGYRAGLDRDGDGIACEPSRGGSGSSSGNDSGGGNVYYKNCAAVRAAGKAPIRRGEPGYGRHLDRDGDGIGCE